MTAIALSDIQNGGAQMRVEMKPDVVREYADDMAAGAVFAPVDVYYDGSIYWLADGYHRVAAARKLDRETIDATVHEGGERDAILHGIGSNDSHGIRRTQADKRRAVELALAVVQMMDEPAWATLGTSGFKGVELPDRIRQVVLAPDGDDAGQTVIQEAAHRLAGQGREVRAAKLPAGRDWCDVLDDYEERAGILEFDFEHYRDTAKGLARDEALDV